MRTTVVEIQRCRPHLGLPEPLEATLAVFGVVDQLQTLLMELEKVRGLLLSARDSPPGTPGPVWTSGSRPRSTC